MIVRSRAIFTLAAAAVMTLGAAAQQTPQPPAPFRSGVDLVTLDLNAMGPDGSPIRDLRADEVRITVGGRPRTIKSFEFVQVAPLRASAKAAPVAPAGGTTRPASSSGRNVYVVVLHEHIRPGNEHLAMEGVRRIVDQLEPGDRVALVTMPFGRVEVELTADHSRVRGRLHQIVGRADVQEPVAMGTRTTSEAIDLLEFLKSIAPLDGPKTVLLISEGFQTGGGPFETEPTPTPAGAALLDRPETTTFVPLLNNVTAIQSEVRDLRTAAAVARAQFYVIQPHNFVIDPAVRAKPGAMRDVRTLEDDAYKSQAGQTGALAGLATLVGGRFLQLSGRSDGVFDRIVRETSGYYAVAFETDQEDRDSKARSVAVSTTRAGVELRARRTFIDSGRPAVTGTSATSVQAMLADRSAHGALPLRAGASVTRAADGQVKVVALAESLGGDIKEAGFALIDAKGTVVKSWPAEVPGGMRPVVSAQVVQAGHYRLRAAAIDAAGTGGSVDYEFDAVLPGLGSLSASSLMTGVLEGTTFKPRLAFTPGDDVVAYFELYGAAAGVEVAFELAPRGGAAFAREAATPTATRDESRRVVNATFSLGSVAAGDYVLRALVRTGSQMAGTLTANITIVP